MAKLLSMITYKTEHFPKEFVNLLQQSPRENVEGVFIA